MTSMKPQQNINRTEKGFQFQWRCRLMNDRQAKVKNKIRALEIYLKILINPIYSYYSLDTNIFKHSTLHSLSDISQKHKIEEPQINK